MTAIKNRNYWVMNVLKSDSSEDLSTKRLLIFKTNIKTKKKVASIAPLLQGNPIITDWFIDTEDVDNVLRIEAEGNISENDIISLVTKCGFCCEILED